MKKVLIAVFILLPLIVSAQNIDLPSIIQTLQQQIAALEKQIADLQTKLAAAKQTQARISAIYTFTKTLQRGMTGDEVRELQEFLIQFPEIGTATVNRGHVASAIAGC